MGLFLECPSIWLKITNVFLFGLFYLLISQRFVFVVLFIFKYVPAFKTHFITLCSLDMDQIFKARWIFLLTRIWPLLWSILNVYISARLLGELNKSLLNSLFYWEHLLLLICFKECYLNECQCRVKEGDEATTIQTFQDKKASYYSRHYLMENQFGIKIN